MKGIIYAVAAVLTAAGCGGDLEGTAESVDVLQSALNNGQNQGNFLTLRGTNLSSSEDARQKDTCNGAAPSCGAIGGSYYTTVGVSPTGSTSPGTIASALSTLTSFRSFYGFGGNEVITRYYNRGDLGIGREMHCVDKLNVSGNNQIACYVTNFAAGDDGSEFTFGLSSNIAFSNMTANHSFATVAMVYRDQMAKDSDNRVFFVVYNQTGGLQAFAALDRHGITFANEFANTKPNNPAPAFGTPGATFSNHVPSNCVACHGGQQYLATNHTQVGSLFLPFDLEQFDYDTITGRTRAEQEASFRTQNEMVRKVAALQVSMANPAGTAIKNQLDTWYANTNHTGQTDRTEVFENNFDTNRIVAGWTGAIGVFQQVVRPLCRNCHVSNQLGITFDTQTDFNNRANASASFICGNLMPHALQTARQFWQSTAPSTLVSYLNSVGQTAAASQILGCGPRDVVTLDPPEIMTGLAGSAF
jgi:hypothetical protein